jgi:hypothetical protein
VKKTLALLAAGLLAVGTANPAAAAPPTSGPTTLATGLVTPLHVSIGTGSTPIVSEESASRLTRIGTEKPLYDDSGWDVAGTATQGSTTYVVQSQGAGPEDTRPLAGSLVAIDSKGTARTITEQIGAWETAHNPDGETHYGAPSGATDCIAALEGAGFPGSYSGEVDSHPYAIAVHGNTAYVADAGGNDILAVNLTSGAIRTLAVIPPRTVAIPALPGLEACAGVQYSLEAVPTDVTVGPDGWLYVSSLPGGPEDGSLGANGSVYRVNPTTGAVQEWVTGLVSPTGIAFDGSGNLYVAALFGGGVFKVAAGTHAAQMFLEEPLTADVTVKGSTLYATTDVFGAGKLISLKL